MGVAASLVARLLHRFRWLAWVGLAIVFYVSVTMIHAGSAEVLRHWQPDWSVFEGRGGMRPCIAWSSG